MHCVYVCRVCLRIQKKFVQKKYIRRARSAGKTIAVIVPSSWQRFFNVCESNFATPSIYRAYLAVSRRVLSKYLARRGVNTRRIVDVSLHTE